jgi:hypothetical protein
MECWIWGSHSGKCEEDYFFSACFFMAAPLTYFSTLKGEEVGSSEKLRTSTCPKIVIFKGTRVHKRLPVKFSAFKCQRARDCFCVSECTEFLDRSIVRRIFCRFLTTKTLLLRLVCGIYGWQSDTVSSHSSIHQCSWFICHQGLVQ